MSETNYTVKTCTHCHEEKDLSQFSKDKCATDGYCYKCKVCSRSLNVEHSRTKKGLITRIYSNMKSHSIRRGDNPPEFTLSELREWALKQIIFHDLHDKWVESGFHRDEAPSFDRTDDYQGYSLSRLKLMPWHENKKKGMSDIKNGINNKQNKSVIQMTLDGLFVAKHYSISQAGRDTVINFRSISLCCLGKLKTAGGFKWEFAI